MDHSNYNAYLASLAKVTKELKLGLSKGESVIRLKDKGNFRKWISLPNCCKFFLYVNTIGPLLVCAENK